MADQQSPYTGRRKALDTMTAQNGSTNSGLWFDRYYLRHSSKTEAENKQTLMVTVAGLETPRIYHNYYHLWRHCLPKGCTCAVAKVQGRMVIGTGDKGVSEAGITLHHTYGVPLIPGSALKGLAAAYAHMRLEDAGWRKPSLQSTEKQQSALTPHEVMFGSIRCAGYVTFFDALYIPGSIAGNRPLAPDVITSHHSDYYVSGTTPPADWDSPVPVPFLTATGSYLIALDGPAGWVNRALTILGMALRDSGIGAKTAAGYGRMRLYNLDDQMIDLPGATMSPLADDEPFLERGQKVDKTAVSNPTPPVSTRTIPRPGDVFTGKVLERDTTNVAISVPGHAPESVIAILQITAETPNWRPNDSARVEVIQSEERGAHTILTVRRAPRSRKS